MVELIRDTVFEHFLELVLGRKISSHPEDEDPSMWKQYLRPGDAGYLMYHGYTAEGVPNEQQELRDRRNWSQNTSETLVGDERRKQAENMDPEKGRDVHVIDWYGDNDQENPMNWSRLKKSLVTSQICLLTAAVYVGSSIYTPGIDQIMVEFGVSEVKATLGLSLFIAGYGTGPMIWAPMSEVPRIGRNPIYIGTLIAFVVLQLPVALAPNFATLLCFRFITGFVGSPVLATGGASIGDIFSAKKKGYGVAMWGIAAECSPVLAPIVGGFAAQAEGWKYTIWELMILSGVTLILVIFFLPETSTPNILYRRARRLRKLSGNDNLKSGSEILAEQMTWGDVALAAAIRPFTLNFQEPIVFVLNLYSALIYGFLYVWFESFPLVFRGIYHFNLGEEGLAFLGILVTCCVMVPPFFWYLHKYIEPQCNEKGELQPEKRLPSAMVGAFAVPICFFWFGWSARPSVHWIMPIIGSGFFQIGLLLLVNSTLNYLGDSYSKVTASVLAGNGFMRCVFGASFPLFATAMYTNLGIAWASSTLAFLSIAFIPVPFVLYKYGERLRGMSKYAQKDF